MNVSSRAAAAYTIGALHRDTAARDEGVRALLVALPKLLHQKFIYFQIQRTTVRASTGPWYIVCLMLGARFTA